MRNMLKPYVVVEASSAEEALRKFREYNRGAGLLIADVLQVLLARVHVHLSWVSCFAPSRVTFSFDPTESFLVTF